MYSGPICLFSMKPGNCVHTPYSILSSASVKPRVMPFKSNYINSLKGSVCCSGKPFSAKCRRQKESLSKYQRFCEQHRAAFLVLKEHRPEDNVGS